MRSSAARLILDASHGVGEHQAGEQQHALLGLAAGVPDAPRLGVEEPAGALQRGSSPGSQATSNTRPPISRMSSGMSDLLDKRLQLRDQVVERGDVLVALDPQPVELVRERRLLASSAAMRSRSARSSGCGAAAPARAARAARRRSRASASWASSWVI